MKINPPTNFDDKLIDEFKALGVEEVYGKLPIDIIGGGRPTAGLQHVSKKRLVEHIYKLHQSGIKFNYLLNAASLNFEEYSRSGRKRIYRFLDWLVGIGVDKVTVAIPYLLQLIKDRHPNLQLSVSTIAEVTTARKAQFWHDIGANEITLSHPFLYRDFKQLRLIRQAVDCEIKVIANAACLYQCALFNYHNLWDTHASQSCAANKPGLFIDYSILLCKYLRMLNPAEFIRSQWIRPEDISVYEDVGIDTIKLVDRRSSTSTLLKIAKAYSERKYSGNLIDLLPAFQAGSPLTARNIWNKFKYFFHPFETNLLNCFKFIKLTKSMDVYIDNNKLDGFISKFLKEDCNVKQCSECRYCDDIAKKVVVYNQDTMEQAKRFYKEFLDNLVQGKC